MWPPASSACTVWPELGGAPIVHPQSSYPGEVPAVAGDEYQVMRQCRRGDEEIRVASPPTKPRRRDDCTTTPPLHGPCARGRHDWPANTPHVHRASSPPGSSRWKARLRSPAGHFATDSGMSPTAAESVGVFGLKSGAKARFFRHFRANKCGCQCVGRLKTPIIFRGRQVCPVFHAHDKRMARASRCCWTRAGCRR